MQCKVNFTKPSVFQIVLTCILAILSIIYSMNITNQPNVCTTTECTKISARIREFMNQTAEPCHSFYEFACGKYFRNPPLQKYENNTSVLQQAQDRVDDQVRLIFSEKFPENEAKVLKLAETFYQSCMNQEKVEENEIVEQVVKILEPYGGWPTIVGDNWQPAENWDWLENSRRMTKEGFSNVFLFSVSVSLDLKNASRRAIYIEPPSTVNTFIERFKQFVETSETFSSIFSEAKRDLEEVLSLAKEQTKLALQNMNIDSSLKYGPTRVRLLQLMHPIIPWLQHINGLLPKDSQIDENEKVILSDDYYFWRLKEILKKTSNRTIANYFAARIFHSLAELYNENRTTTCIRITKDHLPDLISALYARKYFSEDKKDPVGELAENIRDVFFNMLSETSWMDSTTKDAAIKKAKLMDIQIGYADESMNNDRLEEYYEGVEFEPNQLLRNFLHIRIWRFNRMVNNLKKPYNQTDGFYNCASSADVQASYCPLFNRIQLPAAILQEPYYSPHRPSYMNYGAIGLFIGHEISHGFDKNSQNFYADGAQWWTEDAKKQFSDRAQCFVEQYKNYRDSETKVKSGESKRTLNEDIADHGGMKASRRAYRKFVKENGAEPLLPELDYSPEQLFWISSAQMWCSVQTLECKIFRMAFGKHSFNKFRVIGPLSNIPDFASDFKCKVGSKMNPIGNCEVW